MASHSLPDPAEFRRLLTDMLRPEVPFLRVILIYSAAISLLSLAIPISVQLLIDSVANTGLLSAIVTIGVMLFVLLLFSGVLYALRTWTMELFNRRLYSRISSEIGMTGLLARTAYFEQEEYAALFNRYFDIMTVKKNIPYLLSSGFSLSFQSIIGFIVVSLYHFYFLIFSLILIVVIWLIWKIWGWKATYTAFRLSEAKHETAAWLQGLAINNGYYKSTHHHALALEITDQKIRQHLDEQQLHFKCSFKQLLSLLFIYALASAALLGIGGWLVLQGQLTLGQLVSAELIMSAIFYGLPQLGGYLDYYYDLCAAVEELSRFSGVEAEDYSYTFPAEFKSEQALAVEQIQGSFAGRDYLLNFLLPACSVIQVKSEHGVLFQLVGQILKRQLVPDGGSMIYGSADLLSCDLMTLREGVLVLDRQTLLPLTIREYLQGANLEVGNHEIHQVLHLLQLDEEFRYLPKGLETVLSYAANPLTLDQALRLKLASALLGPARILVLGQIYDVLDSRYIETCCQAFTERRGGIALYCSARQLPAVVTHILDFDFQQQNLREV